MTTSRHSTWQDLPDSLDLEQAPELGPIALLQAAIAVTRTALERTAAPAASLRDALECTPGCDVPLLARLTADRCRELAELLACYRIAIAASDALVDDDRPF